MALRSCIAALPIALSLACAAEAAVITVDTFAPTRARCNLAAALQSADSNQPVNQCAAGEAGVIDEIRFHPDLTGTAQLGRPFQITDSVRIIGNGPDRIAIEGGLTVDIAAGGDFTLSGVSMRNGLLLWRAGDVVVERVRFAGLRSQMMYGSAISAPGARLGRLSIRESEFFDNPGELGVVVLPSDAHVDEVEVRDSRFVGNQTHGQGSGALYLGAHTHQVTIRASDFMGNQAWGMSLAGAIVVERPTMLSIEGSIFHGNSGGESGAIWAQDSSVDVLNSSLAYNRGAAAGAVRLVGGEYFGLRFSAVVDNNPHASFMPALQLDDGPGRVEFLGNVLRAPQNGRVCSQAPIESLGYNQQYAGRSCELHHYTDIDSLPPFLRGVSAGAGRPHVPTWPAHGPGIDRVPFHECLRSSGELLITDIRDVERPWVHGQADPAGSCDVGPIEQQANHFPVPHP